MTTSSSFLVFELGEQKYALRLPVVKRVIPAVEITPLPKAPKIVIGIINMHGQIIPVFNIRKRFHLPDREVRVTDQLIIADTARYTVALLVDSASGIIEYAPQEITDPGTILPVTEYVEGVVRLENDMVLIHNLDTFLSLDEARVLEQALKEEQIQENGVTANGIMSKE